MTTQSPSSWGLEPPPRNLETAPPAVKARLRYAHTIFVTVSFIGAAAGGCLLANVPAEWGVAKVAGMGLFIGGLALGPFLIARSFNQATRACLRDASGTRFVVESVENVSQPGSDGRLMVVLKGRDEPHLPVAVVVAWLPPNAELVGKELVGLATSRGEHLIIGVLENDVVVASPTSRVLGLYRRSDIAANEKR